MAKSNKSKQSPSRKKYEEEHPTISLRLDIETRKSLKEHLEGTGCSPADFIKDSLGREKSMVEKRVKMLASRRIGPSVEDRLRSLEDLVYQILSIGVDTCKYPPYCPHCEGQEMFRCEGRETESTIAIPWVSTWKCLKCGFFINTYKHIDPKSIKWIDPDTSELIEKPRVSSRHWLGQRK
jgi:hypothetical protein